MTRILEDCKFVVDISQQIIIQYHKPWQNEWVKE